MEETKSFGFISDVLMKPKTFFGFWVNMKDCTDAVY